MRCLWGLLGAKYQHGIDLLYISPRFYIEKGLHAAGIFESNSQIVQSFERQNIFSYAWQFSSIEITHSHFLVNERANGVRQVEESESGSRHIKCRIRRRALLV